MIPGAIVAISAWGLAAAVIGYALWLQRRHLRDERELMERLRRIVDSDWRDKDDEIAWLEGLYSLPARERE